MTQRKRTTALLGPIAVMVSGMACGDFIGMDPGDPARGPGQLVGNGDPVSDGDFRGGADELPAPRDVTPPAEGEPIDCTAECRAYCDALALENPVNVGICGSLWGVGLEPRPVDKRQACRRLHADFIGRYPTEREIDDVCNRPTWGETVAALQASDDYALVNQRKWADLLLYNNRAVNFERAYDMDALVGKAFRGLVAWDEFAAVTSAHPVFVRRHDTPGDRAEFLFKLFLGRPPYEHERADIGRLYRLWSNGYWEHPHVGRVPDAFIDYACVRDDGTPDPETIGECTSILWGRHELVLAPDRKRVEKDGEQEGELWAGFLLPEEWEALSLPGRLIASEPSFWEHTVDRALEQYLGYNLAIDAPAVRHELTRHLLEYDGDIRALHFAIATSFVYLQSSQGESETARRWTYGPLKQVEVEGWIDSITNVTGHAMGLCDHRLPHPEDYVGDRAESEGMDAWARALIDRSRWVIDDDREVEFDYRNLARTLGGCPSNEVGGRFTSVSVLNTAVQESFVADVCGIGERRRGAIPIDELLPNDMSESHVLDDATAEAIVTHQQRLFLGRAPNEEELEEARLAASSCTPAPCDAQRFARPVCFALLSSSDFLFY